MSNAIINIIEEPVKWLLSGDLHAMNMYCYNGSINDTIKTIKQKDTWAFQNQVLFNQLDAASNNIILTKVKYSSRL